MNGALAHPMKILMAEDGSQHSLAALTMLRDLPLPAGSAVHVVAVLIPRETSNHSVLEAVLAQTRQLFEEKGFTATTELILGYPAEQVMLTAEQLQPDLIVMGAKGLRSTLGILLGGVAQQVVEYSCCPVLIVRPPYEGLQKVLVVNDGSEYSQAAVEYLARFPLPAEAEVRPLHVLPPPPTTDLIMQTRWAEPELMPTPPLRSIEELVERQEEEECAGQALLEKTLHTLHASRLAERGVKVLPGTLLRGDAATEILEYAQANNASLIVAGSRGLSAMRGWLLGSVSRKLVHYAHSSVLIVKRPIDARPRP